MEQEIPMAQHHIPVSGALLALQIILAILLFDIVYIILTNTLFSVTFTLGTSPSLSPLFAFLILKLFIQSIAIMALVLITLSKEYYLTEKQLIVKQGVLTRDEKIYELHHIKSVNRHQSFLARLIGYGDLKLSVAESGFRTDVALHNIREPKKYERVFMELMKRADSTVEVQNK